MSTASLPEWRCHKIVRASKVRNIAREIGGAHAVHLFLEDGDGIPVEVSRTWAEKHFPQRGGYYVLYGDGYATYVLAEAFEQGYTRLTADDTPAPV